MEEKLEGARRRIRELERIFRESVYKDYFDTFISTFDVNPSGERDEAKAMGRCVEAVMSSHGILYDRGWNLSRGCRLERVAAELYDIGGYALVEGDRIIKIDPW